MKTIHKYAVPIDKNFFDLNMPLGAKILCFQVKAGHEPAIWALVNPNNNLVIRHFAIYGTGENIDAEAAETNRYIGTVQMPPFVWHLFETKE